MPRSWKSSRAWVSSVLAIALLTSTASGQECEQPELPGERRAVVEHQGAPGFWFRRDVALTMLCELRVLEQLRARVSLLESKLQLRDDQVERWGAMYALAVQGETRALAVVEAAQQEATRARDRVDAWYRHPILWVVAGILLGGVAVYLGGKVASDI